MRERAANIGGTLTIESTRGTVSGGEGNDGNGDNDGARTRGRGTCITLVVPGRVVFR